MIRLFSSDPAEVRSMARLGAADVFNSMLESVSPLFDFSADQPVVEQERSFSRPSRSFTAEPSEPLPTEEGDDFLSMVKRLEGFNPKAYDDYKQVSIGYGTRAKPGETSISKAEAERRLLSELSASRKRVTDHAAKHGYQFSQSQIDALTSFDYNTGRLEQLTANGSRSPAEIAEKIPAYRKAGGKVLPGLVKRRAEEQRLFNQ